mgnify:CR=1 FL=1
MNNRGGIGKLIFIVLILIVLVVAVYFSFFFYYKCDDVACFRAHQEKCSKTKFLNDVENAEWEYKIKGKKDGKCEINVKINQVSQGDVNKLILEGKSMDCLLPIGNTNAPEGDISICHGELKEKTQELIIQKLHAYVVKNLGEIGEELGNIQNARSVVQENTQIKNSSTANKNITNSSG